MVAVVVIVVVIVVVVVLVMKKGSATEDAAPSAVAANNSNNAAVAPQENAAPGKLADGKQTQPYPSSSSSPNTTGAGMDGSGGFRGVASASSTVESQQRSGPATVTAAGGASRSLNNSTGGGGGGNNGSMVMLSLPGSVQMSGSILPPEHAERQRLVEENRYQKGRLLGRGANGSVFTAILNNGSSIAMKVMNLDGDGAAIREQMRAIMREMDIIKKLNHPHLLTYYGCKEDWDNSQILIFTELVTGGSLGSMVRSLEEPLQEETCRRFVAQVVSGLAYMHGKGIVHRDLKGDNVLFDSASGKVKIADFGTARSLGGGDKVAKTIIGTPYFMAPEMLSGIEDDSDAGYATKVDVWSLGIMVGELMNKGQAPWPAFNNPAQAFLHIASPTSAPIVPVGLSPLGSDFMKRCTVRDPTARASAAELMEHPWVREFISAAAYEAATPLAGVGGSAFPEPQSTAAPMSAPS